MGAEDFIKKIDVEKYGLWFWLILLGILITIFSIIHDSKYVALGLYFFSFGVLGAIIAMLMFFYSSRKHKKEIIVIQDKIVTKENIKDGNTAVTIDKEKIETLTIYPPMTYAVWALIIRILILVSLCIFILKKYPEFNPWYAY